MGIVDSALGTDTWFSCIKCNSKITSYPCFLCACTYQEAEDIKKAYRGAVADTPVNPSAFKEMVDENIKRADAARATLEATKAQLHDPVNHPSHYCSHPSGIECITVTRHMNFNLGNAIKYLWRAGKKDAEIQDLKKAVWYIEDEIKRLQNKAVSARQAADTCINILPGTKLL